MDMHAPDEVRAGLIRQITAYRTSKCLYALAELGVPDLLANAPMTSAELGAATGTRPELLCRVLDHLVVAGVLDRDPSGRYVNTPSSRLLLRAAPDGLANWVRCELQEGYWHSWDRLIDQLRTGEVAFELAHQRSFFDWLAGSPPIAELFDATMRDGSRDLDQGAVDTIVLGPGETVVDIGGGDGSFLAALLKANPEAFGVLFELPREKAEVVPELAGFVSAGRCRIERGSFFERVPGDGDVYVLKRILHDWDDERAAQVLRHCRDAMLPGGRIAVIDIVLPDEHQAQVGRSLDVLMMVLMAGKERGAGDFAALCDLADLKLGSITGTPSSLSVVEMCSPATCQTVEHVER